MGNNDSTQENAKAHFIDHTKNPDSPTIFDKILKGDIPCKKVYEDEDVLAFNDIQPQAPVHVLVIPKKKWKSFSNLHLAKDEVVGVYMKKVSYVAHQLGLDGPGYRVVFNHGEHGAQSVDYIHAHILAGRSMQWPPG